MKHVSITLKARILFSVILCFIIICVPSFFLLFSHMNRLVYEESMETGEAHVVNAVNRVSEDLEALVTSVAWMCGEESIADALSYKSIEDTGAAIAIIEAQREVSTYMAASPIDSSLNKIVIFNPDTRMGFEYVKGHSGTLYDSYAIMSTDEFRNLSFPTGAVVRLFLTHSINNPDELVVAAYGRMRETDGYVYAELSDNVFRPLFSYPDVGNIYILSDGISYPDAVPSEYMDENNWTMAEYPFVIPGSSVVQFVDRAPLRLASSYGLTVFVGILTASLVLLIVISALLSRYLTRTTSRLEKHIKYLTETKDFGSVNKSIEEGSDEVAAIGRTVNAMSISISELLKRNEMLFEEKKRMEIDMLQLQVNPHFLYNTLESIHYLAEVQKNDGIARMARGLTTLLRNLAKGSNDLIPLSDELRLLGDYDDIQQVRYMGMYELVFSVPDELLGYQIQKFTLQPLVENAIFHGIEPSMRCGTIDISASLDGSDLLIIVADDGVGMTQEEINLAFEPKKHSKTDMTGIGIRNINERIRLMYGDGYGLSFESVKGQYTKAIVRLKAEWYVQNPDS